MEKSHKNYFIYILISFHRKKGEMMEKKREEKGTKIFKN